MGVAQVVQANRGQHRLLHRLPEVARYGLRVEGGAVLLGEDEAGLNPRFVLLPLLIELACRLTLQDLDRARIEGDDAASLDGLRL